MQQINTKGLTDVSWAAVMKVIIDLDPSGYSDYVQHLLDAEQYERAYRAFQIRATMTSDDVDLMAALVRVSAYSFVVNGKRRMFVYHWGRDCDLMESNGVFQIDATLEAFYDAENAMYDNAEGPCHMSIVSRDFVADFKPSWRDRAAEMMNY